MQATYIILTITITIIMIMMIRNIIMNIGLCIHKNDNMKIVIIMIIGLLIIKKE